MPATSRTPSCGPTPTARLRGAGEALAVVPLLCGFVPSESLVVLCLRGPRRQVGLTMRVDLPPAGRAEALAEQLLDGVLTARADEVLLSVWTDEPGGRPHAEVVAAVVERCAAACVDVGDALLVRDGRWTSYLCDDPRCCPSGGTPLAAASPAVDLVAACTALEGRAVLPSRAALEVSLQPPSGDAARAAERWLGLAERERRRSARSRVPAGRAALRRWRDALHGPPDDDAAAALVVSLRDLVVRDEVLTWSLDESDVLLGLLLDLARRAVAPHDAGLCAVVAWVAHARGDGALANVALDRALASDPGCSLAQLARSALDRQVPPSEVRTLLAQSRFALRAAHPWTGEW